MPTVTKLVLASVAVISNNGKVSFITFIIFVFGSYFDTNPYCPAPVPLCRNALIPIYCIAVPSSAPDNVIFVVVPVWPLFEATSYLRPPAPIPVSVKRVSNTAPERISLPTKSAPVPAPITLKSANAVG